MANAYQLMSASELNNLIATLEEQTDEIRAQHLSLDMARGKPSPEQTALSYPMLDLLSSSSHLVDEGVAVDNYGSPDGLPSARRLAAEILGVHPDMVIVSGSSSLNLMHDLVSHAYTHGVCGAEPLCRQGTIKWLCPVPGYDRHFKLTEYYGFENVAIPLGEDGPDMDMVEQLVENDSSVKGIWCVPKYANPSGVSYSDEVVRRFAALKPKAPDFRIYWDNAYIVHGFKEIDDELLNIFDAMCDAHTNNLVYEFGSTAKVTFPSSGMAFISASPDDLADIRSAFAVERVSPEKMSQRAHTLFFHNLDDVKAHMERHAALVRPRFDLVEKKLSEGLSELGIAQWTHPRGGYFVSFDGPQGSARRIVALMAELGVKLTPAGSTWPSGQDPHDSNIRLAPTYPSLDELAQALDVFVVVVKLIAAKLEQEKR